MRDRERDEYARGERWFWWLTSDQKWALGDQLVLGVFDWMDWGCMFEGPPSNAFLRGADDARILWEGGNEHG